VRQNVLVAISHFKRYLGRVFPRSCSDEIHE
jgi:hypothetical protein